MPPEVRAQEEAFAEQQLNALLPESLLSNLFGSGVFGIGGAIALIFGALAAGSEYGWGTLKSVLSQRPGRLGVLLGKLAALGLFLLLFVLLALSAAALGSFAVARLEEAAVDWPSVGELFRGFGAGALILLVWGSLGFALAVLFRGTALAIGLGLAYALAVENILATLPIEGDTFERIRKATLGENTLGLSNSFGSPFPEGFGVPEPLVEPERAVLVLSAYAVGFVLLAALLLWRRDVT
ncbi:ABC transporter permease subunit [Rubrobacter marinus]|uniref:ABC transporter permease subunit n=1 Tax=Rubrobacter marinus TaxID=2653852 RepID=A0A6G8Q1L5_9ACTN|nr:ABC transporter permease subunit [Rubrobacter marinus]QIN80325.1 ABC transporter permease subunit [Rubrobacter marinus]